MMHLVNAIRNSIREQNWYAALGLSLTLPDICGYLESPLDGSRCRFVAWCQRYIVPQYTHQIGADRQEHVFLTGEDCYALRCAFLHEGSDVVAHQQAAKALEAFMFSEPPAGSGCMHCNQMNSALQLQVDKFCEDMCAGAEGWMHAVESNVGVQERMKRLLMIRSSARGLSI